jgi:hypothetical protein
LRRQGNVIKPDAGDSAWTMVLGDGKGSGCFRAALGLEHAFDYCRIRLIDCFAVHLINTNTKLTMKMWCEPGKPDIGHYKGDYAASNSLIHVRGWCEQQVDVGTPSSIPTSPCTERQ